MKNTDTKEKILELLFQFPLKSWHIREIAKTLSIAPASISKSADKLEKEGLLTIKRKFWHEINANLSQKFKIKKRIYNLKSIYDSGLYGFLNENFPLDTIVLFGSYSRGEDTEKSDIDIAIETKEKKLDLEKYEQKLNRRINIEFIEFNKLTKELKENIINGISLQGFIKW